MKIFAAVALAFISLPTLIACSPLAPQPDHSSYFILTPVAASAAVNSKPVSVDTSQLTLGIGPIDFPDYLRRPELVTLTSANEIDLSDDKRWAEPLDKNFSRVLTENLTKLLGTNRIEKYPWSHKTAVDYQVIVDVQRFDTTRDGQSQLAARWMIRDVRSGKNIYASETIANEPVHSGESGMSVAMSSDLATLSLDIANRIAMMSEPQQTSSHETSTPHYLRPASSVGSRS